MNEKILKSLLVSTIVFLLLLNSFPLIDGFNSIQSSDYNLTSVEQCNLRSSWHITNYTTWDIKSDKNMVSSGKVEDKSDAISYTPTDSPWPMLSHDLHRTGFSPYSALDNSGFNTWWFRVENELGGSIESSPVIDDNNTIYFGSMDADHQLYALYPNGTKKWSYYDTWIIWSTPFIDNNGVIYFTDILGYHVYLHAVYTSNHTLKWRYPTAGSFSSPVVTDDGSVIFGDNNNRIISLNPNGTLNWIYPTGDFVASSAAIGDDGMIYIGSSDGYLYALYPNGTLCWRFGTGGWIKGHPTIDGDGTIYVPSFDGYLYALFPNGTMKWKADTGSNVASAGAVIGSDGTLYVGTNALRAFNPVDGSLKWSCDIGGNLYGTVPAVSSDGSIFVSADHDGSGGNLVAVDSNGIVRWSQRISNQYARSSSCIGENGIVYVGSTILTSIYEGGYSIGCLNAFNNLDSNAPSAPTINGPSNGKSGKEYEYSFKSTSPTGNDIYYYIDWDDGYWTDWIGPYSSGEIATAVHTWKLDGNYTIRARAKDTNNLWGPWGTLDIKIPRSRTINTNFFLQFLQNHPNIFSLLRYLQKI